MKLCNLLLLALFQSAPAQPPPQPQGPMAGLLLPDRIDEVRPERYGRILALDEVQLQIIEHAFLDCENGVSDIEAEELPALHEKARAVVRPYDGEGEPPPTYRELFDDREAYLEQIENVEETFFATIRGLLREDQLPAMERLRMDRDRARGLMFTFALPGVLCDLIEFLDRLRLTDEEWAAVDMAAFQYELAMDPDARARARDGAEETVSLPELARAGDPGSDVLLEKIARRDLSIHRNNVTHLPRIAAALPEKHRESFILMFKDRAFPMIHPDLHHAGSMFRELLQEEGLSDGLRLIVSQKFNSYESQYQRTIGAMEERFVEHREIITRTGRMKPAVRAEYDQEMLELHEARVAAAYAAAADLKTLLVAQGATDLVVSVDRFVNFLDNLPQEWRAP